MSKKFILFILLFIYAKLSFGQLSLESCQTKAQSNYPLIKRYQLIEKSRDYNLSNAGKGYLPQISLSAKATYQSAVTQIPITLPIHIKTPNKDQYQIIAEINQTIWDGGIIRDQKKITEVQSKVELQQNHVDLYNLTDRVNNVYFSILLINEQLKQNQLYQSELNRHLNQIKAFAQNGIANQADIDAVKVNLIDATQKQTELETTKSAYIQMLSILIGEKINNNTILTKPDIAEYILSEEINRPELQLFALQAQLLETQKNMLLSKNLPKFGLFIQGGYGNPGLNMLKNSFDPYYIAGVRMSWNFGGLYTKKNEQKQINIEQSTIGIQKETFLFNTKLQMSQEKGEINKYKKPMKDDDEIIRLRANIRKAAEVKVANGTLSVIEFLREVNAEEQAKQNKILHETQLLMATYNLKYTTNL